MACRLTVTRATRLCIAATVLPALFFEPFGGTVRAQSAPIIYPGAGQSMEQQARDETECRNWATQQTGVYPYQAPPTYYGNSSAGMPVAGGAARGAALGAVGGAIAGDAGEGAAIGAGVGAAAGLIRRNRDRRQQAQMNDQAMAQYQADLGRYNQAFAACMQGRGYVIR